MSGLGDALQSVGGWMMGLSKDKMLDNLRKEQEARADERAKASEQRAEQRKLREVSGDPVPKRVNGKMVLEYKNSRGDVIRTEDVDPYTLEKFNIADRKDKLTLDQLTQNVELGGKELRDYDTDKALDRRYNEARIETELAARQENIAQAGAANRRGIEGNITNEQEASVGSLTNQLIKETSDLKAQYTGGNDPEMTAQEYRDVATKVIIEAAKRGVDPRVAFAEALKRYKSPRK